jgi:MYXO-CTERM domain-containing protein
MAKKKKPQPADAAHDVLAAEEFPPPAGADADTVTARVHRLPPDPYGSDAPAHDVLAAEEYPPPAHADVVAAGTEAPASRLPRLAAFAAAALAGYALVRRRRG